FTVVPLHIFEPRYRKMINDSIAMKRRIGVAHTKRLLAPSEFQFVTKESEVLNTDQETYEAHSIFSAGFAELIDTLQDGRMLVEIVMDSRYEIIEELQQSPYKIALCRPYADELSVDGSAAQLRIELDQTLLELPDPKLDALQTYIGSPKWKAMSTLEYSYAIYSLVIFDPDILQKVLELQSPMARINFMLQALGQGSLL
ncbi:MAG: LON peptidase substrate-binding domain-containing protein, partial [Bdellovibrionales bacterium]|nr:LON peptidase substrate-binding domain-containing protein [Oligoflexia bacterium]